VRDVVATNTGWAQTQTRRRSSASLPKWGLCACHGKCGLCRNCQSTGGAYTVQVSGVGNTTVSPGRSLRGVVERLPPHQYFHRAQLNRGQHCDSGFCDLGNRHGEATRARRRPSLSHLVSQASSPTESQREQQCRDVVASNTGWEPAQRSPDCEYRHGCRRVFAGVGSADSAAIVSCHRRLHGAGEWCEQFDRCRLGGSLRGSRA